MFNITIKFRDGVSQVFTVSDWRTTGNTLILYTYDGKKQFNTLFPLDTILEMDSVYEEVPVFK